MSISSNLQDDIKRLRDLAEKATPGPWESHNDKVAGPGYFVAQINGTIGPQEANAEFIAASRTAVPTLCDALEKAIENLERLGKYEAYEKVFLFCQRDPEYKFIANWMEEKMATHKPFAEIARALLKEWGIE